MDGFPLWGMCVFMQGHIENSAVLETSHWEAFICEAIQYLFIPMSSETLN